MVSVQVVRDGMTLDLLIWEALGREEPGLVEQTLALNRGLAAAGTVLPIGTVLILPDAPAPKARLVETVKLWS